MVKGLRSPLNIWYMDDGILGGTLADAMADLARVQDTARRLGLELNGQKCEFYVADVAARATMQEALDAVLPGVRPLGPTSSLC